MMLLLFGVGDRMCNICWHWMNHSFILSADMAVDPGGELVDPGVDPRKVWSATARPPAHNANQEPATTRCLTGQRAP